MDDFLKMGVPSKWVKSRLQNWQNNPGSLGLKVGVKVWVRAAEKQKLNEQKVSYVFQQDVENLCQLHHL